jgi:hypothetical protein
VFQVIAVKRRFWQLSHQHCIPELALHKIGASGVTGNFIVELPIGNKSIPRKLRQAMMSGVENGRKRAQRH